MTPCRSTERETSNVNNRVLNVPRHPLPSVSMSQDETLTSVLDLCRRLPPQNVEANLDTLVSILPDLADDLLSSVDQPLKVQTDSSGREYLVRFRSRPPERRLADQRDRTRRCATTTVMVTRTGQFGETAGQVRGLVERLGRSNGLAPCDALVGGVGASALTPGPRECLHCGSSPVQETCSSRSTFDHHDDARRTP